MDELIRVVVDDSAATSALDRIAAASGRADSSVNSLGNSINATENATKSQTSAFQRLQALLSGVQSGFQRLSGAAGSSGSAFSRLQQLGVSAFNAISSAVGRAGDSIKNFTQQAGNGSKAMDNLWKLTALSAASNVLEAMWDRASSAVSAYIERMTQVQRIMSMLTVVTPTGQEAEYSYIMGVADKYGIRLNSLAGNYAKLAIAAREANVPQETMRRLFEGTAIGARVMHQSTAQVELTFQALTQMLSKGVVSMEELRRQFAERMPGAIHAIAKELGVTYDELTKFVGKGKALSDKFMPYVANALMSSFGRGIEPAAKALDAELNRVSNSFDKFFKQVFDNGGADGPAAAIQALNDKLSNPGVAKAFALWVDDISRHVAKFIQSITMDDITKGANAFLGVLKAIGEMALFAGRSVKWLSENLTLVGGLVGAYMGAKIGFMAAGPAGAGVGAVIGGIGGAGSAAYLGGSSTPTEPQKSSTQQLLESQVRNSGGNSQFSSSDLALLSGLPAGNTIPLPSAPVLPKVGNGLTLEDILGGGGGGKGPKGDKGAIAAANRELERQKDLMAELSGLNKNFEEDWGRLNTIYTSAANKKQGFMPLELLIEQQEKLLAQQPFMKAARKEEELSLKKATKEWEAYQKAREDSLKELEKVADKSEDTAQKLEDEAAAWGYARTMNVDMATGLQLLAQARAEENYQKALGAGADGATLLALQRELEARDRIFKATELARKQDEIDAAEKKRAAESKRFWSDTFSEIDQVGRSMFTSLLTGGENVFKLLGKSLKTNLIDMLYKMTLQKWIINVGTSIFGQGFGQAAMAAIGGAGGGGGAGGLLNMGMQGVSLYSGLTSGSGVLGSIGSALGLGSAGAAAGASAAGALGSGTFGILGASAAPSTLLAGATLNGSIMAGAVGTTSVAATGAAVTAATPGIMGAISSGIGAASTAISSALAAIPVWGWIAAGVAALWKPLFGRKLKDYGIQGQFGGESGFEGEQFKFFKGGIFRSDKTESEKLDEDVREGLANTFKSIRAGVNDLANALKLDTAALTAYTMDIKISTKDLSPEDAQKKFTEALETANNEMAEAVLGSWVSTTESVTKYVQNFAGGADEGGYGLIQVQEQVETLSYTASEYAKKNEKAIDTLTRLASSLTAVNASFESLNLTLYEISLAGADAASKLIDAFGGIDNYTSATNAYFEGFYSEQEKYANSTRVLTKTLQAHNFELPTSIAEYRKLVEAQDLNTDAGRAGYAVLLQNAPAFLNLTNSLKDVAAASNGATKAERQRAKALEDSAQAIVDRVKGSFESLQNTIASDAFSANGGSAGGISVRASEAEASTKFLTAINSATDSIAELEKLGLADKLSGYVDQVNKVIQGMREMLATQIATTRLMAGDASGALDAKMQAAISKPEMAYANFATAGAFNVAYAKEQAKIAKDLISQANSSALLVSNIGHVIGYLNSFSENELLTNDVKQTFLTGIREASGTATTYIVRDAVQSLADVIAKRDVKATYGNNDTGLPAIANAYAQLADMNKVEIVNGSRYMGEVSIEYAKAVSGLNADFNRGKVSADELQKSLSYLADELGDLSDYAVTPAEIVMGRVGASASIANEGLKALNLYFGQLSVEADKLAEAAKIASEPIAVVTDVIGRMNSVSTVFGASANAVIDGFSGMIGAVDGMNAAIATMLSEGVQLTSVEISNMMASASDVAGQGRYGLTQALTYGSDTRKALLVAKGASIASETMITADGSKIADQMATNPVFDALTDSGIRDVAMLLDGLKAFDAASFEKTFIRLSDALKKGTLNEEQYAAMFDTSINIFTDYDNKIKELTTTFDTLRNAAKSLADRLLLDAGLTTLDKGQTLIEAQRQYDSLMVRALQGDVTAAKDLDGVTQNLLTIAKSGATNEQDYGRIFGGTINDLRLVESLQRPERIPEAIEANAQTNAELIAEIKALREELRAGNAQIASNTNKTNKSLQEFQVNGMPTVALV